MTRFLSRLAFGFAAILIASIAFIGAVSFLFYALFLFFITLMNGPLAALATAGVLILFALLVLLIGRGLAATALPSANARAKAAEAGEATTHPLTHILGREIGGLAARNPVLGVAAALAAGLVLGVSPMLRKTVLDLFRR